MCTCIFIVLPVSYVLYFAGLVGLVNQAMTCYLNSLLQTLYMTPEFRNAIYKWEATGSEEKDIKCIPSQLQKLFLLLQVKYIVCNFPTS